MDLAVGGRVSVVFPGCPCVVLCMQHNAVTKTRPGRPHAGRRAQLDPSMTGDTCPLRTGCAFSLVFPASQLLHLPDCANKSGITWPSTLPSRRAVLRPNAERAEFGVCHHFVPVLLLGARSQDSRIPLPCHLVVSQEAFSVGNLVAKKRAACPGRWPFFIFCLVGADSQIPSEDNVSIAQSAGPWRTCATAAPESERGRERRDGMDCGGVNGEGRHPRSLHTPGGVSGNY